jgi:hypothetical protein
MLRTLHSSSHYTKKRMAEHNRAHSVAVHNTTEATDRGDQASLNEPDCLEGSTRVDETMKLSDQELELAKEIKTAVKTRPEIEPLTDMMYGQFAIMALLELDGAIDMASLLDQIHRLQCVREEHRIQGSYASGCHAMEKYITINERPDFVLSFSYTATLGTHTLVLDFTKFDATILSDYDRNDTWMASVYYMFHAAYPNFDAMRNGLNVFVECQSYDWRSDGMFNLKAYKVWSELASNYPCHIASFQHYHTGVLINLLLVEGRKLLPPRIHDKFEVNCRLDVRLDRALLVPSVEVAMRETLDLLKNNLRTRYKNESIFFLDA